VQPSFKHNAVWYVSHQSLSRSWYTDLDYGSYRLPGLELGFTACVTGQQGMLTSPRHLILPLVIPGVRVSLILTVDYSAYLIRTVILTADFSVYLTVRADFDCRLFLLPNLDTVILTTDAYLQRVTDRQGIPTPPKHPIPPLECPGVCVCPILWFVFPAALRRLMTVCYLYLCHFIFLTVTRIKREAYQVFQSMRFLFFNSKCTVLSYILELKYLYLPL
jgi:hypothetical protein